MNKYQNILCAVFFFAGAAMTVCAQDKNSMVANTMHHNMTHSANDERISLGLLPAQKQHQLSNMRTHVDAVRDIVGFIAAEEFEKASQTAHTKLGLTEEMKMMCDSFGNEDFKKLGIAFHKSGDALGDVLQTKDANASLRALNTTLGYCVQCHATFRQ